MNFGQVALGEPKTKRLNITNTNPINITIETIGKIQIDELQLWVEKISDANGQTVPFETGILLGPKKTKRMVNILIKPQHTVQFVFQITAKEQGTKFSTLTFQIKNKDSPDFSISYNYQVIVGNLTLVPSILKFNSGFPGLIQHRTLIARSTFEVPIIVKSISSTDFRFIPTLFLPQIKPHNKTEFGQIAFDPSKHNQKIGDIDFRNVFSQTVGQIDPLMQQKIFQMLESGNEILQTLPNSLNQLQIQNQPKKELTPTDLDQYRQKIRQWEEIKAKGKTEITATLTLETNILQNFTVQVKASLTKPSIMDQEEIDFDLTQIGTMSYSNIKIKNPSEETLVVSLYLANSDEFNEFKQAELTKEEINVEDLKSKVDEKDYYYQLYCSCKSQESTGELFGEILLGTKSDPKTICSKVNQLLLRSNNSQQLKQDIDPFFKDLYLQENQPKELNKLNLIKLNQNPFNGIMGQDGQQFDQLFSQANIFTINPQAQSQLQASEDSVKISQKINQLSSQRPIDERELEFLKYKARSKPQPSFFTIFTDLFLHPLKIMQLFKNQNSTNHTSQQQPRIPKVKLQKSSFRLKNQFLNDMLILNDTTKYQAFLADQEFSYQQNFFINPKHQGQVFRVDPKSELTIQDALIYYPQSLQDPVKPMILILKNNIAGVQPVQLKGQAGTGLIEIVKILKKSQSSDSYINVHNGYYTHTLQDIRLDQNATKQSNEAFKEATKDRIFTYIYGQKTPQQDSEQQPQILRNQGRGININKEEEKILLFTINAEDILQAKDEHGMSENEEIMADPKNFKLNTYHKRIFVAQNTGNLPVTIDQVSIERQGCFGFGFKIDNCHAFTLRPGEQHQIHVLYTTDYTIAKVKKTMYLESKHFIQEYQIQLTLPLNFLSLANQILPLSPFEDSMLFLQKLFLLLLTFTIIFFISKDFFGHLSFMQAVHESKPNTQIQQTQVIKLPIMREVLANDQVYAAYQQAQEKMENQNGLLLKEIANMCAKKNLVCLEAQRCAIEAEKERRMQRRVQPPPWVDRPPEKRVEVKREEPQTPVEQKLQAQSSQDEPKNTPVQVEVKTQSQLQLSEEKIKAQLQSESKDSIFTDLSLNDSTIQQQQTDNPAQLNRENENKKAALQQPRISKKQKREIAQRVKEQQQAEERYRQLQIEKQKQAELEEKERQRKLEQQKQREEREKQEAELRKREAEKEEQQRLQDELVQASAAPASANQSLSMDKENSFNISQIIQEAPEEVKQDKREESDFLDQLRSDDHEQQNTPQDEQLNEDISDESSRDSQQQHEEEEQDASQSQEQTSIENKIDEQQELQSRIQESGYQRTRGGYQGQSSNYLPRNYYQKESDKIYRGRGQSYIGNQASSYYQQYQGSAQTGIRRVQGQGYYSQASGRGLNIQGTYKGRYYDQKRYEDDSNPNYYEKKLEAKPVENTTGRRVVIDTLKNQDYQARNRSRGQRREYEEGDDYYNQRYHQTQDYYQKSYAKDYYDEDYDDSQSYYFKNKRGGMIKKPYNYYDQQDYSSERDRHYERRQFSRQEPMKVSESEREELKEISSAQEKLSKDDLKPFFASQKEDQDKEKSRDKSSPKQTQNNAFGGSIFTFNPLSIFSQSSTSNQPSSQRNQHSPDHSKHSEYSDSKEDFEEDKIQNAVDDEPKDLYNVFKSASSLFSKPLFGATQSKTISKPTVYEPPQHQPQQQKKDSQYSSIYQRNQLYSQQDEEEDDSQDYGSAIGTGLFSGSLFGESSIFGGGISMNQNQYQPSNNRGFYPPQQQQTPPQDYMMRHPDQGIRTGGISNFMPPPGLSHPSMMQQLPTYQQQHSVSDESYSLYGSGFNISQSQLPHQQQYQNQPPFNAQDYYAQLRGPFQNWGTNEFFDDEDDEEQN